jgi:hypothetical protein
LTSVGLWGSYPGPVLSSWGELSDVLQSLTPSRMDVLQHEVRDWYRRFKLDVKLQMKAAMDQLAADVYHRGYDDVDNLFSSMVAQEAEGGEL